jgi:hypothetical protein
MIHRKSVVIIQTYNYNKNRIEVGVLQISISDHYFIVLALETDKKLSKNNIIYKIINYNNLNDVLFKETWADI